MWEKRSTSSKNILGLQRFLQLVHIVHLKMGEKLVRRRRNFWLWKSSNLMSPWMIPCKMYILSLYRMQIPGTIFKFLRDVMLLALAVVLRFGQTVSARVGGGFVYQTQVAWTTKRGMGLLSEAGWCWWCWCYCWWWWWWWWWYWWCWWCCWWMMSVHCMTAWTSLHLHLILFICCKGEAWANSIWGMKVDQSLFVYLPVSHSLSPCSVICLTICLFYFSTFLNLPLLGFLSFFNLSKFLYLLLPRKRTWNLKIILQISKSRSECLALAVPAARHPLQHHHRWQWRQTLTTSLSWLVATFPPRTDIDSDGSYPNI